MNYDRFTIPDHDVERVERLERVAQSLVIKDRDLLEPGARKLMSDLRLAINTSKDNGRIDDITYELYMDRLRNVKNKAALKELSGEFTGIADVNEWDTVTLSQLVGGTEM